MPHFFDAAQRIYWPNGFYTSYEQGVYNALKAYFVNGIFLANTGDTVAREVWLANNYMLQRDAAATAVAVTEAIRASGIPVNADIDEDALAAKILAALPKQPTVFTVTAKE